MLHEYREVELGDQELNYVILIFFFESQGEIGTVFERKMTATSASNVLFSTFVVASLTKEYFYFGNMCVIYGL